MGFSNACLVEMDEKRLALIDMGSPCGGGFSRPLEGLLGMASGEVG
jgi:hypothetical protein